MLIWSTPFTILSINPDLACIFSFSKEKRGVLQRKAYSKEKAIYLNSSDRGWQVKYALF